MLRASSRARLPLLALLICQLLCATASVAQDRIGPFTGEKRSVRSRNIDQHHIRLELDLNWDKRELVGRAVITLSPFENTKQIVLDAAEMEIKKVAINTFGSDVEPRNLKFDTRDNKLTIHLDREVEADEKILLTIDYRTIPKDGMYFIGPTENDPDRSKIVWTQGEAEYARHWFPCFDSPTDRLTSEIIATVPAEYFVLSNGTLQSKKLHENGTQTWHWRQRGQHVTYLMALIAGEFEAYRQEWDGIPIVSYVPKGRLADAPWSYRKTPEMIKFFSEKLQYRYPWAKYAQVSVEDFLWSGMENTSTTTINLIFLHDERAYLDRNSEALVSHEVVHQWFGDLVTSKDWGELWLNEGFAVYLTHMWTEHDRGQDEADWQIYNEELGYQGLDRRIRRPIVTYRYSTPFDMFDGHTYAKAGRILHMLRYVLGDEMFLKAIRHYCKKNANRSVETADLRIAIEEATGRSLNWFFDQWLHHGGFPEYEVDYKWDEESKVVSMTIKQTQKVDGRTPLFRMPIELEFVTSKESKLHKVNVSKAEETFSFSLPERPRRVNFDPRNWVLKTLKFPKSKEEHVDTILHDPHVISRVRSVKALGEFKDDETVTAALLKTAKNDSFYGVRQEATNKLHGRKGDDVRKMLLELSRNDKHAHVRRAAIGGLGDYEDAEVRKSLRATIKNDLSYYAIADALRALAKADKENCQDELLTALEMPSDKQVILRAAADTLAGRDDPAGKEAVMKIFETTGDVDRRAAVMQAVVTIKKDDAETIEKLGKQLDHALQRVRRAAARALGQTADPAALAIVKKRLARERRFAVQRDLRSAVETLESSTKDKSDDKEDELADQIEKLRKTQEELERQLKRLKSEDTP